MARRQIDLKAALQHSRNCKASDPRDRIYAFLGLAEKGYVIVPIYEPEESIVQVLIHTAQRIIQHEKKLGILQYTSQGRQSLGCFLPLWVPDWTSAENESFRSFAKYGAQRMKDEENKQWDASKDLPLEIEFRRDDMNDTNIDLKVKGVFFDYLDDLVSTEDDTGVQSFVTSNGKKVMTTSNALVDDEVWVLNGASKPVVLRPEGDDGFGFLSEALVLEEDDSISDVMFGRLIESVQEESLPTRDIWLL
jgi:hypothetical protein